jgi:hypothetical protein
MGYTRDSTGGDIWALPLLADWYLTTQDKQVIMQNIAHFSYSRCFPLSARLIPRVHAGKCALFPWARAQGLLPI